jgi:hypothetical protein
VADDQPPGPPTGADRPVDPADNAAVAPAVNAAVSAGGAGDDGDKIRCDACPILCFIKPGQTGSCDRYGNVDGVLTRMDPVTVLDHHIDDGRGVVPFASVSDDWDGRWDPGQPVFLTGTGAGTTYPDYKPAPFIVSQQIDGVDMVTVVTEAIFSYCGVKAKIDTDRHIGPELAPVLAEGEVVGHVTTAEYGSQMLSLGGVNNLTGNGRRAGLATMRALLGLCQGDPVELTVDGGSSLVLEAGAAPIVDGEVDDYMRVGCGSAAIGMFAGQWAELVDEVVVVDDHISGVLTEHQAGVELGLKPSGLRLRGRRSTPGRYFEVAEPGSGWGGTNIEDPLEIISEFRARHARPGMTLLMVSTTGTDHGYFELDDDLRPQPAPLPTPLRESVERVKENCEPTTASIVFMAGAGGSLRAGTTRNPVGLTRSVQTGETTLTCGGAPTYLWPGGGITFMVDVTLTPDGSFGSVPTPALVAPLEFTMPLDRFRALGGYVEAVQPIESVIDERRARLLSPHPEAAEPPTSTDRR